MKRLPLYFPLSDGRARGLPKRPTTDERTDLVLVKSDRCQAVQSPTPGTEVSKACVDCISVVLLLLDGCLNPGNLLVQPSDMRLQRALDRLVLTVFQGISFPLPVLASWLTALEPMA